MEDAAILGGYERLEAAQAVWLFGGVQEGFSVAHPSTPASLSVSVLIVDDSADTREMYACALAYSGFRVLHADNGADGLSRAAEALPDVIVTDLSSRELTVSSYWRAFRRIRVPSGFR